jgi:hypothetical protein
MTKKDFHMSAKIMTFHITINSSEITRLKTDTQAVTFIPFTGYTDSQYFKGEIMPGAADVQVTDASGMKHLCAKYIFKGTDAEGKPCHLFVENNGYIPETGSRKEYLEACPRFITDSQYLNEILMRPVFRSEVHSTDTGVDILIFDETKTENDAVTEIHEDPLLMELRNTEVSDEAILRENRRLYEEEKITDMIYFSSHEGKTLTVRDPDEKLIAAVLNDLKGTAQMCFLINEKQQLAAFSCISGKIRSIDPSVLTVYAEIFSQTGQDRYFEKPVNRYPRMHTEL